MLHFHKKNYRIGLDIDDVCCKFIEGYSKYFKSNPEDIKHFWFSYQTNHRLPDLPESFWLDLEPKFDGVSLPFMPTCYVSTRDFSKHISERWLEKHGFPCAPVIHTNGGTKVDACKKFNVNIFVDDFIKNFSELNAAGIETFLYDCQYNRQYEVGTHRIYNIYELPDKIINLKL